MYYMQFKGNKIIAKGYTPQKNIKLKENMMEITKSQYDSIKDIATFEINKNGELIIKSEERLSETQIMLKTMMEKIELIENGIIGLENQFYNK